VTITHARAVVRREDLQSGSGEEQSSGKRSLTVVPEQEIDEADGTELILDLFAYQRDLWQRPILFLDALAPACERDGAQPRRKATAARFRL